MLLAQLLEQAHALPTARRRLTLPRQAREGGKDAPRLRLFGQHSRLTGATFADVHARIPATQALLAATIVTALLTLASALRRDYRLPVAGGVLMAVTLVAGRGVLPVVVQKLQVEPAELAQELPYIKHSIDFTRRGFGLDRIQEETLPAEEMVRPEELRADPETVGNLRLWDPRPLRETYNQIQSIRPYYAFGDVDVDRYRIDGRKDTSRVQDCRKLTLGLAVGSRSRAALTGALRSRSLRKRDAPQSPGGVPSF